MLKMQFMQIFQIFKPGKNESLRVTEEIMLQMLENVYHHLYVLCATKGAHAEVY